jgi:hypothetical protein
MLVLSFARASFVYGQLLHLCRAATGSTKKGNCAAGTMRSNRKNFPEALKVDKKTKKNVLEIGNFWFVTFGDLTAVLWRDRRDVFV